jgi:hypothetical protein
MCVVIGKKERERGSWWRFLTGSSVFDMSGEIMSLVLSLAGTVIVVAVLVLPHLYGTQRSPA